jgi:hypothetical protein
MASYIPVELSQQVMDSVLTDLVIACPKPGDESFAATIQMAAKEIAREERFRYNALQNAIDEDIEADAIAFESQFKVGESEEPVRQMRKFFKREHEKRDVLFVEEEYAAQMCEVFRARMAELYHHGYYFECIIDAGGEMTTVVRLNTTPARR